MGGSKNLGLVGVSEEIEKVRNDIRLYANQDDPVLIVGETGTGKELVANALHATSKRSKQKFIVVNCNDYTGESGVIQSELFGHVKGAFTGANQSKKGVFEDAGGGTIFLDEIGDLPKELHGKLLRVIENRKIRRVGDTKNINIKCRIIAATNKVDEDNYCLREDLLSRFPFIIKTPPLRDRPVDLIPLFLHFYKNEKDTEYDKINDEFPFPVIHQLLFYKWPRNVRELKNQTRLYNIQKRDADKKSNYYADYTRWIGGFDYYSDCFNDEWLKHNLVSSPKLWRYLVKIEANQLKVFNRNLLKQVKREYCIDFESSAMEFLVSIVRNFEKKYLSKKQVKDKPSLDDEKIRQLLKDPEFQFQHFSHDYLSDKKEFTSYKHLLKSMANPSFGSQYIPGQNSYYEAKRSSIEIPLDVSLDECINRFIRAVYQKNNNNKLKTGESLGISRTTVARHLKKNYIIPA